MNLKEKRIALQLTQKEVAKALNITPQAYANYEQGLREPNIVTLIKIAEYYQTNLDYLCNYKPKNTLTLQSLTDEKKFAVQTILKLPSEGFSYIYAKLETLKEHYKITI